MNISPVSNFSYRTLNFKGNNASNPIENENKNRSESLQNNGLEIRFTPETYMQMQINSTFDRLEEYGFFTEDEEGTIDITPEYDVTNEDFEQSDMGADMVIMSLKTAAAAKGATTIAAQHVPAFVKFEYKNYIQNLENSIQETKAQLETIELPDIEDLPDMEEMLDDEEAYTMENIAQRGLAMLPEILEMQEEMLEKFKTTKAEGLKEALEDTAKASNLMFFRIIGDGFKGNARGIVNNLTNDIELQGEPEITDNGDGTSTYLYTNILGTRCEVIRNNQNGDYIRASQKDIAGNTAFEVDFNPNGSIKRLDYVNEIDKSIVSIAQKGNRVIARQIFNGLVTERTFIKTENDTLKQTSVRIFTK